MLTHLKTSPVRTGLLTLAIAAMTASVLTPGPSAQAATTNPIRPGTVGYLVLAATAIPGKVTSIEPQEPAKCIYVHSDGQAAIDTKLGCAGHATLVRADSAGPGRIRFWRINEGSSVHHPTQCLSVGSRAAVVFQKCRKGYESDWVVNVGRNGATLTNTRGQRIYRATGHVSRLYATTSGPAITVNWAPLAQVVKATGPDGVAREYLRNGFYRDVEGWRIQAGHPGINTRFNVQRVTKDAYSRTGNPAQALNLATGRLYSVMKNSYGIDLDKIPLNDRKYWDASAGLGRAIDSEFCNPSTTTQLQRARAGAAAIDGELRKRKLLMDPAMTTFILQTCFGAVGYSLAIAQNYLYLKDALAGEDISKKRFAAFGLTIVTLWTVNDLIGKIKFYQDIQGAKQAKNVSALMQQQLERAQEDNRDLGPSIDVLADIVSQQADILQAMVSQLSLRDQTLLKNQAQNVTNQLERFKKNRSVIEQKKLIERGVAGR